MPRSGVATACTCNAFSLFVTRYQPVVGQLRGFSPSATGRM